MKMIFRITWLYRRGFISSIKCMIIIFTLHASLHPILKHHAIIIYTRLVIIIFYSYRKTTVIESNIKQKKRKNLHYWNSVLLFSFFSFFFQNSTLERKNLEECFLFYFSRWSIINLKILFSSISWSNKNSRNNIFYVIEFSRWWLNQGSIVPSNILSSGVSNYHLNASRCSERRR